MKSFADRFFARVLVATLFAAPAAAQVVSDGRVGIAALAEVGTDSGGLLVDHLIDSRFGAVAGDNWFHSFGTFSIGPGKIASFDGPIGIQRIIAGVSAEDGMAVNGVLRSTLAGVDLFLLSPGGITMGGEAVFDVGGSLHFSTADVLRMAEGPDFEVLRDGGPLLSIAAPSAFGFTRGTPAAIALGGANDPYAVAPGETLSFIGGNFSLLAAGNANTIVSNGSTVQIASVAAPMDVSTDLRDLDVPNLPPGALGEIRIETGVLVDVKGAPGLPTGNIRIRGESFFLGDDSEFNAVRLAGSTTAGEIDIQVQGDLEIGAATLRANVAGDGIASSIRLRGDTVRLDGTGVRLFSGGTAQGGVFDVGARTIEIGAGALVLSRARGSGAGAILQFGGRDGAAAESFRVENGAVVRSQADASGAGGDVLVDALDAEIREGGQIETLTTGASTAQGGAIQFGNDASPLNELRVSNGGMIGTLTSGSEAGGQIQIYADSLRVFNDVPGQQTFVFTTTRGNSVGGSLALNVAEMAILDGGQVFTVTEGAGAGGNLTLVGDTVTISGEGEVGDAELPSSLAARVALNRSGNGGTVAIDATVVEVTDGAEIATRTEGPGDAAPDGVIALRINASERITVDGGTSGVAQITSETLSDQDGLGNGRGGDIQIETGVLEIIDGGLVTASTSGLDAQDAGSIVVGANEVRIDGRGPGDEGTGIFAQANASLGAGGSVTVTADRMTVTDNGRVSVSTRSNADAGRILLDIEDDLELSRGASVTAFGGAGVVGGTGAVTTNAARIRIDGAEIGTRALGRQDAGQVDVSATESLRVNDGVITSQAAAGAGGDVRVAAGDSVNLANASITASTSGEGGAGGITIDAGQRFESVGSAVTTNSTSTDDSSGGSIRINASERVDVFGSEITTNVEFGEGDGGSIFIAALEGRPEFVVLNESQVSANAQTGDGGFIEIDAGFLFRSGSSVTEASSAAGGLPGTLSIRTPEADLTGQLIELPASFLDASQLLDRECSVRTSRAGSFVVKTRAIEPAPDHRLIDSVQPLDSVECAP